MNILIAGDFSPAHRVAELIAEGKYDSILEEVKPIVEAADYSLVNFECPVVESPDAKPLEKCGSNLRTSAKAVELMKWAGFKGATLANNHFLDYGEEGAADTLQSLDRAGIAHVGGGMSLDEASKTMYIEGDCGRVAIINCCEHEFSVATDTSAGSNPLNPVRQWYAIREARQNASHVIIIVHGGNEHYQLPSPRMQETYRYFIDAGADAVVNHHQHCFSGYERYHGKPIFYGLGNFCFDIDGPTTPEWHEGFMLQLSIKSDGIICRLLPYSQCAGSAAVALMKDRTAFDKRIAEINAIISDPKALEEQFDRLCDSRRGVVETIMIPYSNRWLKSLAVRRLLPTFINKRRLMVWLAYTQCESHLSVLLSTLKKRTM